MYIYVYIYIYMYIVPLRSHLGSYIYNTYMLVVVISDPHPRHTECSNPAEVRSAQHICNHENNVSSRLSQQWL